MNPNLIRGAIALSAAGLIALAGHEGYSDKPYLDVGGIWTDNFGNTGSDVGKVKGVPGALQQLGDNVLIAEKAVQQCITQPMTQGQYDAFTLFTYNVGSAGFCGSTLVRKFNTGDSQGACDELMRWVYVKGKKVQGLVNRREKERQLCLS